MARLRDEIQQDPTPEYFQLRLAKGWKIAAVEWEFEEPTATEQAKAASATTIPYGLKLSAEPLGLGFHPTEVDVLLAMLEMIVSEKRIPAIANELNRRGHRTRDGKDWTAVEVFELLPRLIELGPVLLNSHEWRVRRPSYSSLPA